MVAEIQHRVTAQEYLAFERKAEEQHEFVEGVVYAVSGRARVPLEGPLPTGRPAAAERTREHGLVTANVVGELRHLLRSRPCEAYGGNVRVKISAAGAYVYPDVVVACEDIQFEDVASDVLLNPLVVIEVLSPTTEAYDRGKKAALYRQIPSLQQYVLVAQDRVSVEVFTRQGGQWGLTEVTRLDETVRLDAIDCDLPLAEVYAKVRFPEEREATAGPDVTLPPAHPPA